MLRSVVSMIHVPDVRKAAQWYQSIGFVLERVNEDDGVLNWALLSCGASQLMFNIGGRTRATFRREVDLYVHVDDVEVVRRRLGDRVEIVEDLHDVEYGMREFIIRDLNRFWITFGQPIQA